MSKTYTYTARNATDPAQIVTLTLHRWQLSIEPGPGDHLDQVLHVADGPTMPGIEALTRYAGAKAPVIDVSDVAASVDRDGLRLIGWGRTRDRKWLPLTLMIEHVDNLPAARAFVRELNRRKMAALRRDRLQRWLTPRLYWFAGGVTAVLFAAVALRLRHS